MGIKYPFADMSNIWIWNGKIANNDIDSIFWSFKRTRRYFMETCFSLGIDEKQIVLGMSTQLIFKIDHFLCDFFLLHMLSV